MRKFLYALAALAALTLAATALADGTNQTFDQRSPLKYVTCAVNVGATASATGVVLCGVQAPGKIVDLQLYQAAVGVGGTSWSVALVKNATTVTSTAGVLALAGGVNTFVQTAASPDVAAFGSVALPTGATRPILSTTAATVAVARGDVLTINVTNSGTYSTAFTGQVRVLIDPTY